MFSRIVRMAGYKQIFTKYINAFSTAIPTNLLISLTNQKLIVPVYHLISDEKVPHIEHLYQVKKVNQFKKDLDFLLKNYNPISYADFEELTLRGEKPQKKSFLLTFDDGLSEFSDVIAPILVEKGIPAINFLNSAFVDNKNLFFRYKVSLLIEEISKNESILNEKNVQIWLSQFSKEKNFKTVLKEINFENKHLLDDLAMYLNVDFKNYLEYKKPYLTCNQIIDLQKKGFQFGAHSVDHPEYRFIDLENQLLQTKDCLQFLKKNQLLTNNTFAFPFTDYGVSKAFFENVFEKDKALDLSFGCAGFKKDFSSRHIQRIPFEATNLTAKQILNAEYIYFILKGILGKNKITRK